MMALVKSGSRSLGSSDAHRLRHIGLRAHNFTVIGFRGVQQKDGVAGWRGVENDKPVLALIDRAGEGAEDGDFFCARRSQIFFQHGPARCIETGAGLCENLVPVNRNLFFGVDAGDREARNFAIHSVANMGGGIGCGQCHLCPRRASETAIDAAIVVFPTPPLPMVMMTPRPAAAISSTSLSRFSGRRSERLE